MQVWLDKYSLSSDMLQCFAGNVLRLSIVMLNILPIITTVWAHDNELNSLKLDQVLPDYPCRICFNCA